VGVASVPKFVGETNVAPPPLKIPKIHRNLLRQAMEKASPINSP
jgi:hypothetical protein